MTMKRITLAILLAASVAAPVAADIGYNPPQSAAERYDPALNGRNNLANGYRDCAALEEAWEATFDEAAEGLERATGRSVPRLRQLMDEDLMHTILNDAYNEGDQTTVNNVMAAKEAYLLWMSGNCWEKY